MLSRFWHALELRLAGSVGDRLDWLLGSLLVQSTHLSFLDGIHLGPELLVFNMVNVVVQVVYNDQVAARLLSEALANSLHDLWSLLHVLG